MYARKSTEHGIFITKNNQQHSERHIQNQLNSSKHKNRKTKKLRNLSYRALYLSQSVAI